MRTLSVPEIETRAQSLRQERVPFVHARVVRAEKPTSAKPGDSAIVLSTGAIEGFVGGTCAQATVRTQALSLLDAGGTRMLRITPKDESDRELPSGTVVAHNPCLSGGALELFLEAVIPSPLVLVYGEGPVSRVLLELGKPLGHEMVDHLDPTLLSEARAVVIAAHGGDEHIALAAALASPVPYIGLVASRRRGTAIIDALDLDESQRARVHTPAGLDIGAITPEEVAVSIFAQIIAVRPTQPSPDEATGTAQPAAAVAVAVDPVCGMDVVQVPASLHLDLAGVRYWFCGPGCLRAFSADPRSYVAHGKN